MFEVFNLIDPMVFLIAFCVGVYMCYAMSPQPKVIVKKPTPANSFETIYKDEEGTCYRYNTVSTQCKDATPILVDEENL